ncbi:hypothetical protein JCM3766R1_005308 [Sporobolomyces carnicolor]
MSSREIEPVEIGWIFKGTVVSPELDRSLSIAPDQLVVVDKAGFIAHVVSVRDEASLAYLGFVQHGEIPHDRFVELGDNSWILPGFVDTHIHAPQYVNAGMALDRPLMEWLEHYTFKAEARIDADPEGYGKEVYERLVARLLENGTTAASVFGTISVEANMTLARAFVDAGIRGQIGKVAMDQNSLPNYIEKTLTSLDDTRRFITSVRGLASQLVEPVVTPRFVPTCSRELLVGLEEIARTERVRIQSHLAESIGEVEVCKNMLGGQTDVEYFNELGLLNPSSLMAHCTHATASDLALLARTRTSIAHCPLSNVYFSSERQLPLREAWDAGVRVGLGSDISGGYRVGLDENMRWSVGISKLREGAISGSLTPAGIDEDCSNRATDGEVEAERRSVAISWQESIFLATLGGAQALGLDETRRIGRLAVGMAFDAQLIRLGSRRSRVDWFGGDISLEEKVEKWWCNGNEVDRTAVWVQGKRVYSNADC